MSAAYKCDVCGALFEFAPGVINIDGINVAQEGGSERYKGRDCVDLCAKCAPQLLAVLGPALEADA